MEQSTNLWDTVVKIYCKVKVYRATGKELKHAWLVQYFTSWRHKPWQLTAINPVSVERYSAMLPARL